MAVTCVLRASAIRTSIPRLNGFAMSEILSDTTTVPAGSRQLKKAIYRNRLMSREGISERLFAYFFSGLVYPQIWEDPDIDMEAMDLGPQHRVVTIASGGCNVLAYLTRWPAHVDAVDLNRTHIALNRLKLTAIRHLPGHADVERFFGKTNQGGNRKAYDRHIAPHLDPAARAYWEGRNWRGQRRIELFDGNFYRAGLLGWFLTSVHLLARIHGVDASEFVKSRCLREQRRFFDERLAPLFDRRLVRWITGRKASLFGLGIPPTQYDALLESTDDRTMASVLRRRVEKLCCHFPLHENYFARQAFGMSYDGAPGASVPAYLDAAHYDVIRDGTQQVTVHNRSFTDLLAEKPNASTDRYVLLDAQDWMSDAQLNALWAQIDRTARPGARVIFRTAGEPSILPGRVSTSILDSWDYRADESARLHRRDRSAIYGGFHLYVKQDA